MPPRFPHDPDGWEQHSVSMLPLLGNFLFLLVILGINLAGIRGYGEAEFLFAIIKVIAVVGFM